MLLKVLHSICQQIWKLSTQVGGTDVLRQANYGEISWSDPAILEGFQFLLDMGNNGYLGSGVTTIDMDTQNSMFLNGQAAMLYNGSWFVQNLNSDANTLGEDVGFFAFPKVEGGKGTGNNYVVSYGVTWAFSAKAWDEAFAGWFEYVFSHYGDKAMSSGGAITPYALYEEHETPYYTQMILDAMEQGGEVAVWPEFYVGGEIQTAIYEQAQNLAIGATTPENAAKAIDESFAAVLLPAFFRTIRTYENCDVNFTGGKNEPITEGQKSDCGLHGPDAVLFYHIGTGSDYDFAGVYLL